MGNNNIATIDLRLIVKRIIKEKYVFLIVLSLSLNYFLHCIYGMNQDIILPIQNLLQKLIILIVRVHLEH